MSEELFKQTLKDKVALLQNAVDANADKNILLGLVAPLLERGINMGGKFLDSDTKQAYDLMKELKIHVDEIVASYDRP